MNDGHFKQAEQAYQDLYNNHKGMLDDLAAFWAKTAAEFADVPGVIGYEPLFFLFPYLGYLNLFVFQYNVNGVAFSFRMSEPLQHRSMLGTSVT
jgi:hypothetical protein